MEGEDGRFVEQVLDLPPEFSAAKLAVELTATVRNKAVEAYQEIMRMQV